MQHLNLPTFWRNAPLIAMLLGLVFLFSGCGSYLPVAKYNFAETYEPTALVRMEHKTLDKGAQVSVDIQFTIKNLPEGTTPAELAQKYNLFAAAFQNYTTKKALYTDTISLNKFKALGKGTYRYQFILEKPSKISSMVLLLYLENKMTETSNCFDIPINLTSVPENSYWFSDPTTQLNLLNNIANTKQPVLLNSNFPNANITVKYYPTPFIAALPPFMSDYVPPRNPHSRTFQVSTGTEFIPDSAGLYYFQPDSAANGFALLARDFEYPKITRTSELADPLLYITKRDEREKLAKAGQLKPVLDQFWLEVGGSKENARRVIKNFYEQVEYSNYIFTGFKDGWRTDRGLVFIIFGKPDKVTRYGNREEWYYKGNANFDKVLFTFVRKPTLFTADNFELVRDPVYQDLFYSIVDLWRRGVIQR
jgi:GWxTD domain-containing protein